MGLFNSNYTKPGPGIEKDSPKKKGLSLFYELLFRKFWRLLQLNLLYIVTLLPTFAVVFVLSGMISNKIAVDPTLLPGLSLDTVTAARVSVTADLLTRLIVSILFTILWGGGPATAGFVYILRSYVQENPVFLLSEYFGRVKSNFGQALAVWVIDVIIFVAMCYAYCFYGALPGILYVLKYVILVLAFFYTLIHQFLYHLLITYKLSIVKLYKNSALFALSSLPWCTLAIAVIVFLILICPAIGFTSQNEQLAVFFTTATFVVIVFILFALCGFVTEFNACTQVRKYIKEDADVEEK